MKRDIIVLIIMIYLSIRVNYNAAEYGAASYPRQYNIHTPLS